MCIVRAAHVADAPTIARVHVDSWRTTYRGILPDAFLAQLSREQWESMWSTILGAVHRRPFVYVATSEPGDVVGFASGGPERTGDPIYKAELYAIYLLAPYQGQGIGRRLVGAVVERLVGADMRSMLVWVASRNPARHFYAALGGERIRSKYETIGATTIEEIAYGWLDVCPLIADLHA